MKTLLISGTTQLQVDTIGDDQRDMKLILLSCYYYYIKYKML